MLRARPGCTLNQGNQSALSREFLTSQGFVFHKKSLITFI